jgi:hypothetical protein
VAYKILCQEDALADLEAILDYIRADNPAAADSTLFGFVRLRTSMVLEYYRMTSNIIELRLKCISLITPWCRTYKAADDAWTVELILVSRTFNRSMISSNESGSLMNISRIAL